MILIDSSVFLKHFLEGDEKAYDFLKNVKDKAVICDIIVNEVIYILMKQYIVNKYDLKHYDAIDHLKKPDIFQEAFENALIFTKLITLPGFLCFNLQSFRNEFRYPYIMFWK